MGDYESVQSGPLRLKSEGASKKKKKKNKEAKKILEQISKVAVCSDTVLPSKERIHIPLTKAEKAFLKMKEKKQAERILEKASKTHKQSVEKFNHHLDSLTEHYDIPKVSWTK